MMAYMGRLHHTDSEMLFRSDIQPYIGGTIKLRRIISDERKLQRETEENVVRGAA